MFTGIVQGKAAVLSMQRRENALSFKIGFPDGALADIKKGASIAINGVCLTVTNFHEHESWADFDVIDETLDKTNLNAIKESDNVNFERSAKYGDEVGGHIMSGHIQTTAEVMAIKRTPENCAIELGCSAQVQPYLMEKGFIGLNGCSLTLGKVSGESFWIHLIPETLEATTFGDLVVGDQVNLEIDSQTQAIVETVKRFMSEKDN